MKQTLLVKNLIMVAIFLFAINVASAQHEQVASSKDEVATEVKDSLVTETAVVDQKFDPTKYEFPADELNGGSEVATEKADYNPNPKQEDSASSMKTAINWLVVIAILILFILLIQLNSVIGLLGEISGKPAIDWAKWNPRLMLLFLILFLGAGIWEFNHDSKFFFPQSASEHGIKMDAMFNLTTVLILIVFFLTQTALFWFAYKYRTREGHKAYYYPHNDRLEVIWTIIPAIALAVLITNGLKTWGGITAAPPTDAQNIEIYAFQFGWKARYAGEDKKLGEHNFRLISAENDLGINWKDEKSHDDMILTEIHVPVNKNVNFKFRAKDVIHSAYMPYFRAQMNVVPGVPTNFWMKPIITTAEMKEILRKEGRKDVDTWDYYVYCNKICGSAHYNMKIKMVVETEAEYNKWLSTQKSTYASMMGIEKPASETPNAVPADSAKAESQKTAMK